MLVMVNHVQALSEILIVTADGMARLTTGAIDRETLLKQGADGSVQARTVASYVGLA
jgi:hypothetical protein